MPRTIAVAFTDFDSNFRELFSCNSIRHLENPVHRFLSIRLALTNALCVLDFQKR